MRFARVHQMAMNAAVMAVILIFGTSQSPAQSNGQASEPGSALSIPSAQLIQPEALNGLLSTHAADKPLVLQVGSHVLYAEAHIPGSKYGGPGSQPSGLELLTSITAKLSKDQPIVLYCGCCPWNRCPNLEPAFQKLKDVGFTNVKALYIADNFGSNWVDKGFPVERGR
jgi:thiosulfate/3-mercaptopyruvate sulfurtransferase